jgi:hypothetical protein
MNPKWNHKKVYLIPKEQEKETRQKGQVKHKQPDAS